MNKKLSPGLEFIFKNLCKRITVIYWSTRNNLRYGLRDRGWLGILSKFCLRSEKYRLIFDSDFQTLMRILLFEISWVHLGVFEQLLLEELVWNMYKAHPGNMVCMKGSCTDTLGAPPCLPRDGKILSPLITYNSSTLAEKRRAIGTASTKTRECFSYTTAWFVHRMQMYIKSKYVSIVSKWTRLSLCFGIHRFLSFHRFFCPFFFSTYPGHVFEI